MPGLNPFQSPTFADPTELSVEENPLSRDLAPSQRRDRSALFSLETTFRALAVMKAVTASFFLVLFLRVLSPNQLWFWSLPNATWRVCFAFLVMLHLLIGVGLWYLHAWARWLQVAVSIATMFLATGLMSNQRIPSGVLLVTVHAGLMRLLLHRGSDLIFSRRYREAIPRTVGYRLATPVAWKCLVLAVAWAACALFYLVSDVP